MLTQQRYHLYTATEQGTWMLLFDRQFEAVKKYAYFNFLPNLKALGFSRHAIPDFENINFRLRDITGWGVYAVPGLIENRFFFEQLYDKKFGATTWMRKCEQLDYLEEPDMFHDVFGHVPLLADPMICDYLHGLARIAKKYISNEEVIEAIARIYWYTIEFGLIRERGHLRIYGAGILSSIGETEYSLSHKPVLDKFNIAEIIKTPYIKDNYQERYFIIDSLSQLTDSIKELETHFSNSTVII